MVYAAKEVTRVVGAHEGGCNERRDSELENERDACSVSYLSEHRVQAEQEQEYH